ncbi:MAG: hypothetical protein R2911_07085 [Caldilineaceae bacterium]
MQPIYQGPFGVYNPFIGPSICSWPQSPKFKLAATPAEGQRLGARR